MNKLLLVLAVPALLLGAVFFLLVFVLVLMVAPPELLVPAFLLLGVVVLWAAALGFRRRSVSNSLDGEASLLPSAKSNGGLL